MQMLVEVVLYLLFFLVITIVMMYFSALLDRWEDKKWDEEIRKEEKGDGRNLNSRAE